MSATLARQTETPPKPHRFTTDEFHLMGEVGLLDDAERFELLEGEIGARLP
jgi:hypothetical protein